MSGGGETIQRVEYRCRLQVQAHRLKSGRRRGNNVTAKFGRKHKA